MLAPTPGFVMRNSRLLRTSTAVALAGVLAVGSLAGSTLGCSDDPDAGLNVSENQADDNDDDSAPAETTTETLVDQEVDLVDHYSDPIEVDVPEDVYSINISVVEGDGNLNYLVTDWTAPDGFEVVPAGWENDDGDVCYPDCANRVMMSPGAVGAVAPNNPDAQPAMQPGTHEFTIHSREAMTGGLFNREPGVAAGTETVRVLVHAETASGATPETGEMDLNLFFTGAHGWTADSAPDDEDLQAVVDEIDEIYDQVGIDIRNVAYHDVEGDHRVIEDLFTGTGDLAQLLSQSDRAELDGPSVFFVEDLMGPFGGGGVLGISGGIPGPMLVDGSVRSGVAVGTDSASAVGAPGIAQVTAHEIGHYLGLYHTTEQMGMGGFGGDMPQHDPLPDTDENDESYLMHATGQGDEMSEWQGRVMRKNPWVEIE